MNHEEEYKRCANLVAAMIEDAKLDMRRLHRLAQRRRLLTIEQQRFNEAQAWLKNGGARNLLSAVIGIDTEQALAELKWYAQEGYLTDRREHGTWNL